MLYYTKIKGLSLFFVDLHTTFLETNAHITTGALYFLHFLYGSFRHKEIYMSLDKAIKHKKEHRIPYSGAKAIDPACRNHGGCSWCRTNRTIKTKKQSQEAKSKLREGEL